MEKAELLKAIEGLPDSIDIMIKFEGSYEGERIKVYDGDVFSIQDILEENGVITIKI